ncbi:iron reductase [Desarmillaria tabescens]|uniref:ferric-chelate reductase (NADPH) n=1 Tax=Armillaria tabescens TaxID=1929756 RepID=A0AA39JZA6_ARMTA|nr:iron reductase [Desarmillaria tabescens]KAK0450521.1 iron reductase [Desarmillaria tabescens]
MSAGTAPTIPTEFQQYNSYVEDPKWQRRFTAIWASCVGAAILYSLPYLVRSIRNRRTWLWFQGVSEDFSAKGIYVPLQQATPRRSIPAKKHLECIFGTIGSVTLWTPPFLALNVGQIFVILAYLAIVLVCIIVDAQLKDNPNRAGFLALAQLPVVFLFATKNSLLSLLLGPGHGYEKLNYVHRWSGRFMFLGAVVHGSLWIRNHLEWNLTILGEQKETSGIAALGVLCVIVLTSVRPARRVCYEIFFVVHVLGFVAFFITICYHTTYASPWIFPPLAFYGLDMLMRLFRYRIKDATVTAVDNQMTIIRIPDCDFGWEAGQHICLRVFFSGRVFESHPLTILSAPSRVSCISSPGIILGARVSGDWTRALNVFTANESAENKTKCLEHEDKAGTTGADVPVQVMLDGPYGGCSIDLGQYESVLLFAGGSGATFTIGLLDDIVGKCVKLGRPRGERTKRIEFVWCIRSFGSIDWFAPMLMDITNVAGRPGSTLDVHVSIYVTCLCNPDAVPSIPNSDVIFERPGFGKVLGDLVTPPPPDDEEEKKLSWVGLGGGVGVCVCGPESLIREASNAVARLGMTRSGELGGVGLHTELFSM